MVSHCDMLSVHGNSSQETGRLLAWKPESRPSCRAKVSIRRGLSRNRRFVAARGMGDDGIDGECFDDEGRDVRGGVREDWRSFRAKLVLTEKAKEIQSMQKESSNGLGRSQWMDQPRYVEDKLNFGGQVSSWSHQISHPERGCLLVARQHNLGMFSYSVVLITEHDDSVGSSGLVLNMPTPLQISNLGLEENISNAFGKNSLYIGGPMTRNLLHVLHGCPNVEGAIEIIAGVYAGGVENASELVNEGLARPDEFRLLAGYSGWEPYQLAQEVEEGSWFVVSASPDIILGCIRGDYTAFSYDNAHREIGISGADDKKVHCWKAILKETGIPIL